MHSNVDPNAEVSLPEEPTRDIDGRASEPAFGLDGASQDRMDVSERLYRRLKREAAMYGHEAVQPYLASLLELDAEAEDFYARVGEALGVEAGRIQRVIEGHEQ